jgi:hypothetical protein
VTDDRVKVTQEDGAEMKIVSTGVETRVVVVVLVCTEEQPLWATEMTVRCCRFLGVSVHPSD